MEMIVFVGIPASGKSSFYKARFFGTHMRISLDLFNTRNKEGGFMETAFSVHQRMVIDNTNVTRKDRSGYIQKALAMRYRIIGYYFVTGLQECMVRNAGREGKERVVDKGLIAKSRLLELPEYEEGFDELYSVSVNDDKFCIKSIER